MIEFNEKLKHIQIEMAEIRATKKEIKVSDKYKKFFKPFSYMKVTLANRTICAPQVFY